MARRITETYTASQQAGTAEVRVTTGRWESALVYFEAVGFPATALVLRPSSSISNFQRADGTDLPLPLAGAGLHTAIGPGCQIAGPLPPELVASLTCAGSANVRVEVVRWEEDAIEKALTAIGDGIRKLATLLSGGRR